MRLALLCLPLVVLACQKAEGPAAPPVTFTPRPVVVGSRFERSSTSALKLELTTGVGASAQVQRLESEEDSRLTWEVRVVKEGVPVETRVTFGPKSEREAPAEAQRSVVSGHSYLVALEADALTVKGADGTPVEEDVRDEVLADSDFLGHPDEFSKALVGRALHVGEAAPQLEGALRRVLNDGAGTGGDSAEVSGLEVKLTGVQDGVATFAVHLVLEVHEAPLLMTITLSGALEARTDDAQLGLLRLEGPLSVRPAPGADEVSGTGTLSLRWHQRAL